ncbi:MAG: leucine-rich repeat domain-containing protein [Candidatus Hodarchaeota archaeon]
MKKKWFVENTESIICFKCKHALEWVEGSKFCPYCGAQFEKKLELMKDELDLKKCARCKSIAPIRMWKLYLGCPECITRRDAYVQRDIERLRDQMERSVSNAGEDEYVVVFGEEIDVIEGILDISHKGIRDINSIIGFNQIRDLRVLDLSSNQITDISGLRKLQTLERLVLRNNKIKEIKKIDTLVFLEHLDLRNNQLTLIEDIGNLVNLKELGLGGNLLSEEYLNHFGGLDEKGYANYPQEFVERLRESFHPIKDRIWTHRWHLIWG